MKRKIEIYENSSELGKAAAKMFTQLAESYIKEIGQFNVSLAGGGTPETMHRLLKKKELYWEKINIFFSDERYVAPAAENSNYYLAYHSLLKNIDIPNENIFPIPTLGISAKEAAAQYENTIRQNSKDLSLDALFLGIGPDGHTASIFPNSKLLDTEELVIAINDSPKPPKTRISFSLKMLNRAKNVVFLASGKGKAEAVKNILKEDIALPANRVRPEDGSLLWLLDRESATML